MARQANFATGAPRRGGGQQQGTNRAGTRTGGKERQHGNMEIMELWTKVLRRTERKKGNFIGKRKRKCAKSKRK